MPTPEPATRLTTAELKQLAGIFQNAQVDLDKDQLRLKVPGQLPYPLVPVSKTRIRLQYAPEGYFAEFGEGTLTVEHGQDRPAVTLKRKREF